MSANLSSVVFPVSLHHTGLLVRDVEEAANHYCSLLGYRRESTAIDDPVQTAQVLFLRLPGAIEWLELIAPLTPGSKLRNQLAKGGGLHHLCYEVERIEAAVEWYRNQGCLLISAPVAATAFPGRRIAWLMDRHRFLFELLETGPGPLSLSNYSTSS